MKKAAIGIDVGGTKTLCLLVDGECRTIFAIKFKTAPHKGRKHFVQKLLSSTATLAAQGARGGYRVATVGIACAGRMNEKKLRIESSQNLLCLEKYAIGKHLQDHLGVETLLANDVQMGLYGEYRLGVARGASNVVGVFFGTGVGGAAILNDKLYSGACGCSGQVGAALAQPVGGPQAALSHGIVDRIASKSSIASEALVMAIKQWAPYLHKRIGTDLAKVTWGMLAQAIEHGDKKIEEMLRARMRVVGIALSSIINFLNPDLLVLGGGMIHSLPGLVHEELEAGLREYLTPEADKALKVKSAQLKGEAVALGAACAALENLGNGARGRKVKT